VTSDATTGELVIRLVFAVVLGAAVGLERDMASRGAGARTHALVALGAALFTIAGAYGFADVERSDASDPSRIAAQVATGVGFIGAGAIIRHGASVRGITTAATVWLAASIGVAAAAGAHLVAGLAAAVTLVVLIGMRVTRPLAQRLGTTQSIVEIDYERGHGTLGPLLRIIESLDGHLDEIMVNDDDTTATSTGRRRVTMHVSMPRRCSIEDLVEAADQRPEVRHVRIMDQEL
jgi:putative Mg2+ transporter-C (MgtC) family protein